MLGDLLLFKAGWLAGAIGRGGVEHAGQIPRAGSRDDGGTIPVVMGYEWM